MEKWQQSWAHNKYWVMWHSQQFYNQLRFLAKNNNWDAEKQSQYQTILKQAETISPTVATMTTAYQHVWGYFKKIATSDEKKQYLSLLDSLQTSDDQLGPFLANLTQKYQVKYLLNSRLIQEIIHNY